MPRDIVLTKVVDELLIVNLAVAFLDSTVQVSIAAVAVEGV